MSVGVGTKKWWNVPIDKAERKRKQADFRAEKGGGGTTALKTAHVLGKGKNRGGSTDFNGNGGTILSKSNATGKGVSIPY